MEYDEFAQDTSSADKYTINVLFLKTDISSSIEIILDKKVSQLDHAHVDHFKEKNLPNKSNEKYVVENDKSQLAILDVLSGLRNYGWQMVDSTSSMHSTKDKMVETNFYFEKHITPTVPTVPNIKNAVHHPLLPSAEQRSSPASKMEHHPTARRLWSQREVHKPLPPKRVVPVKRQNPWEKVKVTKPSVAATDIIDIAEMLMERNKMMHNPYDMVRRRGVPPLDMTAPFEPDSKGAYNKEEKKSGEEEEEEERQQPRGCSDSSRNNARESMKISPRNSITDKTRNSPRMSPQSSPQRSLQNSPRSSVKDSIRTKNSPARSAGKTMDKETESARGERGLSKSGRSSANTSWVDERAAAARSHDRMLAIAAALEKQTDKSGKDNDKKKKLEQRSTGAGAPDNEDGDHSDNSHQRKMKQQHHDPNEHYPHRTGLYAHHTNNHSDYNLSGGLIISTNWEDIIDGKGTTVMDGDSNYPSALSPPNKPRSALGSKSVSFNRNFEIGPTPEGSNSPRNSESRPTSINKATTRTNPTKKQLEKKLSSKQFLLLYGHPPPEGYYDEPAADTASKPSSSAPSSSTPRHTNIMKLDSLDELIKPGNVSTRYVETGDSDDESIPKATGAIVNAKANANADDTTAAYGPAIKNSHNNKNNISTAPPSSSTASVQKEKNIPEPQVHVKKLKDNAWMKPKSAKTANGLGEKQNSSGWNFFKKTARMLSGSKESKQNMKEIAVEAAKASKENNSASNNSITLQDRSANNSPTAIDNRLSNPEQPPPTTTADSTVVAESKKQSTGGWGSMFKGWGSGKNKNKEKQ